MEGGSWGNRGACGAGGRPFNTLDLNFHNRNLGCPVLWLFQGREPRSVGQQPSRPRNPGGIGGWPTLSVGFDLHTTSRTSGAPSLAFQGWEPRSLEHQPSSHTIPPGGSQPGRSTVTRLRTSAKRPEKID